MTDKKWVPRHVVTEGYNDGRDCSDLFKQGITHEKFYKWLETHCATGPIKVHLPTKNPKKKKTKAKKTKKVPAENDIRDEIDSNLPGWPDLITLDSPTLPKMRSTLLPGFAGKYVRALSAATETPIELAFGMVLGVTSIAVARSYDVQVMPGYIEPSNIWILVPQPSGTRKSANLSATTAPLVDWEFEHAKVMAAQIKKITSKRKTDEARAKKLRNDAAKEKDLNKAELIAEEAADIEAELPEIPSPPQLWTSDVTPERLGVLLAENNECMSWLSAEGGLFETIGGRYSNGIPNLDLMLKSHSGDPERVDRGSRPPVYLRHPLLTIVLSPQLDVLRGLASKPGFRGRGLLGRFLNLMPESKLGYRTLETTPIPPTIQKAYLDGIKAMLDWKLDTEKNDNPCRHAIKLSQGASEKRLEYAKKIEKEMRPGLSMEHVTDWAGKSPGAAVRIAGILHGIENAHGEPWKHEIAEETMVAAVEIMDVVASHSLAALDLMGADAGVAAARHVWAWVERGRLKVFTIREAFNALKGTFPRVKDIRSALEVLEERGYVDILPQKQTGGPGRPASPAVLVRPDIYK